jgi:hypothetical protein
VPSRMKELANTLSSKESAFHRDGECARRRASANAKARPLQRLMGVAIGGRCGTADLAGSLFFAVAAGPYNSYCNAKSSHHLRRRLLV